MSRAGIDSIALVNDLLSLWENVVISYTSMANSYTHIFREDVEVKKFPIRFLLIVLLNLGA